MGSDGAGIPGIAAVAMTFAIGPAPGCHVNPAGTVGVDVTGRMPFKDAEDQAISRLIGAALGRCFEPDSIRFA